MKITEGHFFGTGIYRINGINTPRPIESIIDIKNNKFEWNVSGFWYHHDGTPKNDIDIDFILSESGSLFETTIRYGGLVYKGIIDGYGEHSLGVLKCTDSSSTVSVLFQVEENGFTFEGVVDIEPAILWNVRFYDRNTTIAKDNVVSIK